MLQLHATGIKCFFIIVECSQIHISDILFYLINTIQYLIFIVFHIFHHTKKLL